MATVQAEQRKLLVITVLVVILNLNKDTTDHKDLITIKVVIKIDKTVATIANKVDITEIKAVIITTVKVVTITMVIIVIKVVMEIIDRKDLTTIKVVSKTEDLKAVDLTEAITLTVALNKEKLLNNFWLVRNSLNKLNCYINLCCRYQTLIAMK